MSRGSAADLRSSAASRAAACTLALALLLGAAVAAAWVTPARAFAAASPARLTITEFASRLGRAHTLLAAAHSGLDTTSSAAVLVDSVAAELPATLDVAEGTATVMVDLAAVTTGLRDIRTARTTAERRHAADALLTRIDAMGAAVPTASGSPADPSDAAALREITSALPNTSSTAEDWFNQQIQKFLEWLSKLLGQSGPGPSGSAVGTRVTIVVVLALPILLALIVIFRALRSRRRRATAGAVAELAPESGSPAVAAAADLPEDALGYARGLAAAGAHRDAVRALYGGAARHLVEAGAVSRMRTRTNREMLRDVTASAPELAAPFEDLTTDFERAWYGHAEPGPVGFDRARGAYEQVVCGAVAPAPPEPEPELGPERPATYDAGGER